MQVTKDYIRKDIIQASARLFMAKGFSGVSMREIASAAHTGVGNIYNYFRSKDQLFYSLVAPALKDLEAMLEEHHGRSGYDIMAMCDEKYLDCMVSQYTTLIGNHSHRLALLLFKSQGSSLATYRERFTDRATALVKTYFADMKTRHPDIYSDVTDFSLRIHTIWMFTLFEEILRQKVAAQERRKAITEYLTIEIAGWRELMKI